jgi:hypothetical protein
LHGQKPLLQTVLQQRRQQVIYQLLELSAPVRRRQAALNWSTTFAPSLGNLGIGLVYSSKLFGGDRDELLWHAAGDQLVRMVLHHQPAIVASSSLLIEALTPSTS